MKRGLWILLGLAALLLAARIAERHFRTQPACQEHAGPYLKGTVFDCKAHEQR